ncbi:F0F1 ATP synthase subunit gamma [Candidatus Roizmanbacteria bacterium]|nr:F0F1 ATP synthase subunit gamma [Candidatus Roizmanbacteria bacterium]
MSINTYSEQIEQISALETIAGAYSEIAALRIDNIRNSFEQNSLYYEEISQIYHLVKRIADSRGVRINLLANGNNKRLDTLYVAITSNHGFYGPLNSDAVDTMVKDATIEKADRMIIGAMGISYARSIGSASPFNSMVFSLDEPTSEEIYQFLDLSLGYRRIYVYYPKYISMLKQMIDRIDITHSPESNAPIPSDIKYIFEPELSKILAFFEEQVRYLLFARVLLETNLSRTATRLITMDQAERDAHDLLKKLHMRERRDRQSEINANLVAVSGQMKKWRK